MAGAISAVGESLGGQYDRIVGNATDAFEARGNVLRAISEGASEFGTAFSRGSGRGGAQPAPTVLPPEPAAPIAAAPPEALALAGINQPTNVLANAEAGVNAEIAAREALADQRQLAQTRRQLGVLDTSDIDTARARLAARAEERGRPPKSGSIATLDKLESARRGDALAAMQAIDTNAQNVRAEARAGRSSNALISEAQHRIATGNIDEVTKANLDFYTSALTDPNMRSSLPEGVDAYAEVTGILNQIDEAELAKRGAGVQGKAYGGEILPAEGVPPQLPGAISEEPLPLDSGDYIIPVEAMRFYGRKFFQDLINKAEDTE